MNDFIIAVLANFVKITAYVAILLGCFQLWSWFILDFLLYRVLKQSKGWALLVKFAYYREEFKYWLGHEGINEPKEEENE